MPTPILMPALSPTMTEGKLAKWRKKEGDKVKSGDVLAEIETDKATMEVEAVDEGVLAAILIPDGTENVAVNTPIAVIAADGESADSVAAPAAAPASAPAPAPANVPPVGGGSAKKGADKISAESVVGANNIIPKIEIMKPYHILSGYFINAFFKNMFRTEGGNVLEEYKL